MADPTIGLTEKLLRLTIDEAGKVVPASPRITVSCEEEISWFTWCEACSKMIREGLSSIDMARTLGELHREANPGHPADCIIVKVRVDYIEEIIRL